MMMLMKKLTGVFKRIMKVIKCQFDNMDMEMVGNLPDMLEKVLYMMDGGGMGGDTMEKKMKIKKILEMIRKLSEMVMNNSLGSSGNMTEQWEMVVRKIMENMMGEDVNKEMGEILGYLWKMIVGEEDMGQLWEDKENKEEMKVKMMMLMKKLTGVFKRIMKEIKSQFEGMDMEMEGNLPDMLGRVLDMMEEGMDTEDCCPYKKIWGSMNPRLDGVYTLVSRWEPDLPYSCESPCVYEKEGSRGRKFCFAPSMVSQAECMAEEGEKPVEIDDGDIFGSGMKPEGYGSGEKPDVSGSVTKPEGYGSGMGPVV